MRARLAPGDAGLLKQSKRDWRSRRIQCLSSLHYYCRRNRRKIFYFLYLLLDEAFFWEHEPIFDPKCKVDEKSPFWHLLSRFIGFRISLFCFVVSSSRLWLRLRHLKHVTRWWARRDRDSSHHTPGSGSELSDLAWLSEKAETATPSSYLSLFTE